MGYLSWRTIIIPGKNKFGIREIRNIKNDRFLLKPFLEMDLIVRDKIIIKGVMGDIATNRTLSIIRLSGKLYRFLGPFIHYVI